MPTVSAAQSQAIRVQRFSDENGLSNNQVTSIQQDADGFIWLATHDGLNRFDGFSFKVYQPRQQGCPLSIQKWFNNALIDHGGTMWVITNCGLNQYDLVTNRFLASYELISEVPSVGEVHGGQSIYEDRRGQIWVGVAYGIRKYDRIRDSFDLFLPYPSAVFGQNDVGPIIEDHQGYIWIGSSHGGLSKFDPVAGTFSHYRHDPDDDRSLASDSVIEIFADRSGTLWVGTPLGLQRFDTRTGFFDHFRHDPSDKSSISDNFVTQILEDRLGNLWVGTRYGLNRFNSRTEKFDRFHHNPDDPYSLAGNNVDYIFEDRTGHFWVATQGTGLNRFNPTASGFAYYNRDGAIPNGLNDSAIQAILTDRQGTMWVGTSRGLHKYDATTDSFRVFLHSRDDGAASSRRDDILSLREDRAGTLWVGSRVGLSSFDREAESFFDLRPTAEINEFNANTIFEDTTGALWIGTSDGPIQFDREQQRFSNVDLWFGQGLAPTTPINRVLGNRRINLIHEDRNKDLWFGTNEGLNQFLRWDKGISHSIYHPDFISSPKTISDNVVLSMNEDPQGIIWLGTRNGLNKFKLAATPELAGKKRHSFTKYGLEHGIPGKAIFSILRDDNGFLWLSTDNGLARFDPVTETAVSFDVMDGLQGNEFLIGSHIRAQDGRMYFGGTNGLTAFYPEQVQIAARVERPPIVLTDLLIDNVPLETGSGINYIDLLEFESGNSMFSIEFAALDFGTPKVTQYAYKLSGVNSDWIITGKDDRRATYSGLRPGSYQFQVTGGDDSGVWEDRATTIDVSILSPFWMTWWAYTLYAIAAVLMIVLFVRFRTVALTRRAEVLEDMVQLRTRQIEERERLIQHQAKHLEELLQIKEKLFTNISHEFRTPLTLILGPIKRMLRQAKDTDSAMQLKMVKDNGQRLLRLVDQLLGLSRLSAEEPVTQSAQPLMPMVKTIVESFQPLAAEKRIQLGIIDGDELWVNCSPDALEKILLNLVSNAIKYTPDGGYVNVKVISAEPDMVHLSVSDSGIGINPQDHEAVFERFYRANGDKSTPGAGIGLALVKELAEAFNGSVELESRSGLGTTVSVLLPRHRVRPLDIEAPLEKPETGLISLEIAASALSSKTIETSGVDESSGKASVLLVEDNVDMQEYLISVLSDSYQCQLAADGEDGVRIALQYIPDLVLCDAMLPKMDGFEASKTIKTNEATSHIPIVMLTALGDHDNRLKGLREHVDDYVTKPFDDEELMLRIANLLSARDAMKRRYSRQLFDGSDVGHDLGQREQHFLDKVHAVLESNHSNSEFRVDQMSAAMAMSGRQLQRKLKALVDHSPAEYLRNFRLTMAIKQLKKGARVGLVADAVGFSSQAYFASCFKAEFGATPSEFKKGLN